MGWEGRDPDLLGPRLIFFELESHLYPYYYLVGIYTDLIILRDVRSLITLFGSQIESS